MCCVVPPLFVIEFLHRIMDTFKEYFGTCSEIEIKDNFVVVYEVSITVDLLRTYVWHSYTDDHSVLSTGT